MIVVITLSGLISASDIAGGDDSLSVFHVNSFLTQCVDLAGLGVGLQCDGLNCVGEEDVSLSLEQLQRQECVEDADCAPEHTQMTCTRGRCDCPPYTALNLTSCSCQPASLCLTPAPTSETDNSTEACTEHNGRRCDDPYCSCFSSPDFKSLLVDPTSLFCVLPAGPEDFILGAGANSIGLAVLGALIGFLAVVLVAVFIVATYKNCVCERVKILFKKKLSIIPSLFRETISATLLTEIFLSITLQPGTILPWTMSARTMKTSYLHFVR